MSSHPCVGEGAVPEQDMTRADAIGAWVCGTGVAAAILLMMVYAAIG